jgi:hypothetical protein
LTPYSEFNHPTNGSEVLDDYTTINERTERARELERLVLEIEINRIQMEETMAKAKILKAANKPNEENQKKQTPKN